MLHNYMPGNGSLKFTVQGPESVFNRRPHKVSFPNVTGCIQFTGFEGFCERPKKNCQVNDLITVKFP